MNVLYELQICIVFCVVGVFSFALYAILNKILIDNFAKTLSKIKARLIKKQKPKKPSKKKLVQKNIATNLKPKQSMLTKKPKDKSKIKIAFKPRIIAELLIAALLVAVLCYFSVVCCNGIIKFYVLLSYASGYFLFAKLSKIVYNKE